MGPEAQRTCLGAWLSDRNGLCGCRGVGGSSPWG